MASIINYYTASTLNYYSLLINGLQDKLYYFLRYLYFMHNNK